MRRLVVDASVALKWLVSEAQSDLAVALRPKAELIAPDLLLVECGNALWKKTRRGEIDAEDADLAIRLLAHVDVEFRPMRSLMERALEIARRLDHPVYDCVYLALAQVEGCAFVSADGRLLEKARAVCPKENLLTLADAAA